MKILYHHRIRSKDGQYVHLTELKEAFQQLGHEVMLVGPDFLGDDSEVDSREGIVDWVRKNVPQFLSEMLEFFYSLVAVPRLVMAIVKFKPDFIYERFNLFFPIGVFIANVMRIPIALEINGPLYEERIDHGGITLKWLARWSQGYVWRNADLALPVSEVLATYLDRYGVDRRHVEVIHNGINPHDFTAPPRVNAITSEFERQDITLGFTGFIRDWHRVDRAINFIADYKSAHNLTLLIVGDGPAIQDLKNLAITRGVSERVVFMGLVQRDAIPSTINRFDVAIQSAATEYASPLKLIEYFAAGCAIIAPDQANIRELIDDGQNGFLFDPKSDDSFNEKLALLITDTKLRFKLRSGSVSTIKTKQLTWPGNAQKIASAISRLKHAHLSANRPPNENG